MPDLVELFKRQSQELQFNFTDLNHRDFIYQYSKKMYDLHLR